MYQCNPMKSIEHQDHQDMFRAFQGWFPYVLKVYTISCSLNFTPWAQLPKSWWKQVQPADLSAKGIGRGCAQSPQAQAKASRIEWGYWTNGYTEIEWDSHEIGGCILYIYTLYILYIYILYVIYIYIYYMLYIYIICYIYIIYIYICGNR